MGAGHAHALYVHEHSIVHRIPAAPKVLAALAVVAAVAVTPREAVWAFAGHAVVLGAVAWVSRVGVSFVLKRLVIVMPFIAFALLIPFVAGGEDIGFLGMTREGLWASWNVIAKATLGATASILLAATTEVPEIVRGLGRLRVPSPIVQIMAFMVRYVEIVTAELRRMRTAMDARAFTPRAFGHARPMAASAGALFIRSYERGERIHQAMLARGYTGSMPDLRGHYEHSSAWSAWLPVVAAWVLATVAMVTT